MKVILVLISALLTIGCSVEPIKKVRYGKVLDKSVKHECFSNIFEQLKLGTEYSLSIQVEKNGSDVKYYELTIDGTEVDESHEEFTPNSWELGKRFLNDLTVECSI